MIEVADDLMALADAVGVSQSARAGAGACRSLVPAVAAGGGRAGAASLGSGAVPKPTLPKPLGPPRFGGDDRPQPGQPGPPPDPTPYPPPAMPPVPPWVAARRRLAGFGPQYDVLPGVPR